MNTSKKSHQNQEKIGISTSKEVTALIPQSSSEEKPVVLAEPSKLLASTESLPTSTTSMNNRFLTTSNAVPTVLPTEEDRMHAGFARVAVLALRDVGLCTMQRVLAEDQKTVLAIRVTFNPELWTEDLLLKK